MKPGGRVALAVFRAPRENPWPNASLEAVRHLLPPMTPPTPGIFSWAEPAHVCRILEGTTSADITTTRRNPAVAMRSRARATDCSEMSAPRT